MTQPPPRSTRTDTRFPRTTRCRSDALVDSHIRPGLGLWVRVTTEAWTTAGEVARDKAGFSFFDFLSAIDWLPSPYGRYEDSERSEEHTSELQSLMRTSYAVLCLQNKNTPYIKTKQKITINNT